MFPHVSHEPAATEMSTQCSKFSYFVIIGREGPQIQEILEELAQHAYSQPGFTSRADAEDCIKRFNRYQPNHGTPEKSNRYPNSSTHWEEYNTLPLTPSRHPLETPLPSPGPSATNAVAIAPPATVGEVILSEEQKRVLSVVKRGGNVFFTGPAGTGKSVLLRKIITDLRQKGLIVAVTASTGIAAINISGSTLHSFAGIGLGREEAVKLAQRIGGSVHARDRWVKTHVLVIDEISMIDGRLFDKLEHIARIVREDKSPFGGLQLVLSGDFFQLPPVPQQSHEYKLKSTFAFDAESWTRCIGQPHLLTTVYRQRDPTFVDILSAMRTATLNDDQIIALSSLSRPINYPDGIEPSRLFPKKVEVQACNTERLNSITGKPVVYHSMDFRGIDVFGKPIPHEKAVKLLDDEIVLPEVKVKLGAQVMLISNVIQGCLVNGSLGKVIGFMTAHEAMRNQIMVTEMKKQQEQEDKKDPYGRVPKRPKIEVEFIPLNDGEFKRDDEWPLVQFTNGHMLLCAPVNFTVEGYLGNVEAKRVQVPLILAWALSIHKSQGQTLDRVKVDLRSIFEKGQAYVALSRATSMEGLEIVNFSPTVIEAHPEVIAWHNEWMGKTNGRAMNTVAGPSRHREPSTPARATGYPSPRSLSRRTTAHRPPPQEDAEMDCDEAISQYFEGHPQ